MSNKLYLISGASSGIGYQITRELLMLGHEVIGVSRNVTEKASKLMLEYPNSFFFKQKDLSVDIDDLAKWVVALSKELGEFSGFVHSAGIQQILPLQSNSYKHMLEIFNLNLFAGLALSKGIADRRVASANGVSIVFISSIASIAGSPGLVNYSATKASLNGAMRSMAAELAPMKIRVNSVLPGFVETEMIEKWSDIYTREFIQKTNDSCPLGAGKVEDISSMVLFLLSDGAKWITGSEFNVDGGSSVGRA